MRASAGSEAACGSPDATPHGPSALALLGGSLATVFAVGLGLQLGGPNALSAAPGTGTAGDSDLDGLGNLAELVWGLDPLQDDSDGDGFTDLEEVALGSDPLVFDATLDTSATKVGIITAADNGVIVARVAIYVPGGNLSAVKPTVGVILKFHNGFGDSYAPVEVPSDFYLGNGTLAIVPAASNPADKIAFFDLPVPLAWADAVGWLPIFATVAPPGGVAVAAAVNNVVVEHSIPYALTAPTAAMAQITGTPGGVVYRPLLPPTSLPPSSSEGEICYQDVVPVGLVDGVVQYEVVESECISADSYCSEDCPSMSGGAVDLFDPLGLIGG